jgi:hypothetical protein
MNKDVCARNNISLSFISAAIEKQNHKGRDERGVANFSLLHAHKTTLNHRVYYPPTSRQYSLGYKTVLCKDDNIQPRNVQAKNRGLSLQILHTPSVYS